MIPKSESPQSHNRAPKPTMHRATARRAMPEWLERRDRSPVPWIVLAGSLHRGEAYTDLVSHRMQVPIGCDETSRCVRAHELMHAKVSPPTIWIPEEYESLQESTVVAAEEFRVNMLIRAAGFPVERHLADGSEKGIGERLGINNDWNGAVLMMAAVSGTKSCRPMLSGIRSTRPEWITGLREISTQLQRLWRNSTRHGIAPVASTTPWLGGTEGWRFTLRVAATVQQALITDRDPPTVTSDDFRRLAQGRRQRFAPLVEMRLSHTRPIEGFISQRSTPRPIGRDPRYMGRLLTDPERRVFAGHRKSPGGTVLIDQSGSMHLEEAELLRLIVAAPGCTVIGYSHKANSKLHPNIWVLAEEGRAVSAIPRGNGGNGVDGPALLFAINRHRVGSPLIWVCDGYVTDDQDNFSSDLAEYCARLVLRHRIHQVSEVEDAVLALTRAKRGQRPPTRAVGPIRSCPSWSAHFCPSAPLKES